MAARLPGLNAGARGAVTRADLRLGSDKKAVVEYYRPLGESRLFLAPRVSYLDENREMFQNGSRNAVYGIRTSEAALDIGFNPDRFSEMRFGYKFSHFNESVRVGSPLLPTLKGDVSALSLRFALDKQESPVIPARGTLLTMKADWYLNAPGAPRSYPALEVRMNHFIPINKGNLLFGIIRGGTTFGSQAGLLQQFTLGGAMRLGAYGQNEFVGNDYLYFSTGYLHRLAELPPYLGGKIMVGGWYEYGGGFQSFVHPNYRSDVTFGFIAETILGPISLGYSFGEGGRHNAYFSFGRLWR